MSAAESLESHITSVTQQAIQAIPARFAGDVYALSFWVYGDDDDPRRTVIDVSYNTRAHANLSEKDASDANEARWNFAFWLQNEIALIGGADDASTDALRTAWLDERGLNYTDAEEDADFDRCLELSEQIENAIWEMCARVGMRLHEAGVLSSKFGSPMPIIIHNLEYYDRVTDFTRAANPAGVADEFIRWVDEM